jgi:S1-C subfamily serine protease
MGKIKRLALTAGFVFAAASICAFGTCYVKRQAARMHQKSCDGRIARISKEKRISEQKLGSAKRVEKIARLYLKSLGIENPKGTDYELIHNLLKYRIIKNQVTKSKLLKPDEQKTEVENNYLIVGGGGGLLLSSDGYFLTANHVVKSDTSKVTVTYDSKSRKARCICWIESFDAALCKMDMDKGQEFKVAKVRFAPLNKIRRGVLVEFLGQVKGKLYRQVGRILATNNTSNVKGNKGGPVSTFYSTLITTAYAEPGFSGGPVFLKKSGELVGFASFTASDNSFSGVARIDHFLQLLDECGELGIKNMKKERQSDSKKKTPKENDSSSL